MLDEVRQRRLRRIENGRLGKLTGYIGYACVGSRVCRIDDGEVQAGLHCVEKEDRIEDLPRIRIDPERQVAHPEDGQHAGQAGLDQSDCFDCLDGCVGKVSLASSDWKGERIKDEGFRGQAVLAAHNRMDFLGRLELPLGISGLASLVDAHRHGNRAVFLH